MLLALKVGAVATPNEFVVTVAEPVKVPPGPDPGGVNVMFDDGHVQFLKDSVNPATYYALATATGGEIISSDSY